jgi:copper transport protein
LLRWLNFTVLLTLVGGVAMAYLILRPTTTGKDESAVAEMRRAAYRRVMGLATICSGLAIVIGLGLLLWQMGTLAGDLPQDASMTGAVWQLLSRTRWGLFWLLRQGILLALSGVLFWLWTMGDPAKGESPPQRQRLGLVGTGLLLLAVLMMQGLTGHAAALALSTTLAVVVDMLHLLAASLWVGGLLALSIGLLPLLRRQNRADFALLTRASWGRFGGWAAISMGVLVATGLYNTGRQVISLDALLATLYGQALLTKMGLLVGIGLVGLCNSILLHPRLVAPLAHWLSRPAGWTPLTLRQLPRLILLEATLGLLALLVTGMITATPPARGAEFALAAHEIPTALDQTIDDMLVTFSARPNRPGQNMFTIRAVSVRRPPPAEVMRVILRFTFLGQDMGRTSVDAVEIEPGLYQVGGNYLSLAGAWQVQVVVRRRGIEDSVAQFNWVVAPPGPIRPLILSRQPLEPVLTLAAGVAGLIPIAVGGVWLSRKRRAKLASIQAQSESSARGDIDDEIDDDRVDVVQPRARWV